MTDRAHAEALAYGLGVTLWLHPDGRIRIAPEDETGEWVRIVPAPGSAPTEHGHGKLAEAKP